MNLPSLTDFSGKFTCITLIFMIYSDNKDEFLLDFSANVKDIMKSLKDTI